MAVRRVKGLNRVISNLNKEVKKIEGRSLKGLIRASILVRRDMEHKFPLIPVDLGNLRASWFIVTSKGGQPAGRASKFRGESGGKMASEHGEVVGEGATMVRGKYPALAMGFSAFYAWYVHENVGQRFRRPGSGAKFFQGALNRNKKQILNTIAKEAKIR